MKTLYYFRHSTKDGEVKDTIGSKGSELARKVGEWFFDQEGPRFTFNRVFHGPLVRTAQTALAFLSGFFDSPRLRPVIAEIGYDALFGEMVKPSQFRTLASSVGNFRALLQCHDTESIKAWSAMAMMAVVKMFEGLEDGEVGLAFGHSPMIELALAVVLNTFDLPEEYLTFGDMEGVELAQDDNGVVSVVRKVAMPAA